MKKNAFLFGSLLMLFMSCAKDESINVNQNSIYTIYQLDYDGSTDKTTAMATFRFGGPTGTLLDLTEPANVTFNGEELLYNSLFGVHKKEFAGLISSGSFVYKDLDNNTFTNTTPTFNTIDFPSISEISSGGAFTFVWLGVPIAENETVTLTIKGVQQSNFEIFSSSVTGTTQLILSANKLKNLGIGNASCALKRTFSKYTVDQGTSEGGRMEVGYSTSKTIYINH